MEGQFSGPNTSPKADVPGELAVAVVNQVLTDAAKRVLEKLTLEQLVDQAAKAAGQTQGMYYI